ncbi:hypothetical protein [Streptomyces kurssanovii]|uniref:TetR family transcriptional regulator n=1 Tax=Streptomyces kurssanovii TaxID=67312 RepID=A0ABV3HNB5_9ACTN
MRGDVRNGATCAGHDCARTLQGCVRSSRSNCGRPERTAPTPELAAIGLMALVDGLGMQLLSRQYAEKDAVAALDVQLAAIFGAA